MGTCIFALDLTLLFGDNGIRREQRRDTVVSVHVMVVVVGVLALMGFIGWTMWSYAARVAKLFRTGL